MTLIIGNDQTNILYGTVGEDTIAGLGGDDYLEGRGGNDVLNGGAGNDDLSGGDGNDLLNGDAGDDELNGGVGNDTADGGSGTDSYNNDYSSRATGLSMNFSSATGNGTIVVGAETDTLISIEKFYDFKGTNFDDTIVGAIGADLYLRGLAGHDLISGNAGGDWIYGGDGNDTIDGGADNDYLYGEADNDVVNGGVGNDDLSGGDGNDLLNGDAGDDELNGGVGNDTADGGSGTDSYNNDYSSRATGLSMNFSSATGNGTIVVGAETDTLISIEKFYDFKGTNFDDTIVGAIGADLYLRGLAGHDLISGNAGGDWIYGGNGNDTIDGGADNDYLYGETGNDILEPGLGRDYADGGTDIDILKIDYTFLTANIISTLTNSGSGTVLTAANSVNYVNIEKFSIIGGSGNDVLLGGDFDDTLKGGSGDDILNGGGGLDILQGGVGDDAYITDEPGENISEYANEGTDIIRTSVSYTIEGLANIENVSLTGTNNVNTTGNSLNNKLIGNSSNNMLTGKGGDDTLEGSGGDDSLNGDDGDDYLVGVNPKDASPGTDEIDIFKGGAGADIIILGDATKTYYDDGNNRTNGKFDFALIKDFNIGKDKIQLFGPRENYLLLSSPIDEIFGTGIFLNRPGDEAAELIAIVEGSTGLELNDNYFTNWSKIYFNDFEKGIANEWSNQAFAMTPIGARRFLGKFSNSSVSLSLENNIFANSRISLDFDLYIIDSWDGNNASYGPDKFIVSLSNCQKLLDTTFSNQELSDYPQVFPSISGIGTYPAGSGANEIDTLGYTYTGNSVYRISLEFYITSPLISLDFAGFGLQGIGDESWGLDNVSISVLEEVDFLPGVLSFDKATYEVDESSFANIIINRSGGSDGEVSGTILYSPGTATSPDDYNSTSIAVIFAAGETNKTVTIPIINDGLFEADETLNLTLLNLTGGATIGSQPTTVITIINDDLPQRGIINLNNSNYTVNENETGNITLTRTNGSDGEVSVTLTPSSGSAIAPYDYIKSPITVIFANGETSQNIGIPLVNDIANESDETIYLTLSNPTGGATLGTQINAVITIVDDDFASQYASSVIALSSQYSSTAWSAEQALGQPNTFTYGDYSTSWAPRPLNADGDFDADEFITVGFSYPVYASGIEIRETFGNGFVRSIELLDNQGDYHSIWSGSDTSLPGRPVNFRVDFKRTNYLVVGAKINVDVDHNLSAWEEIDSVQLFSSDEVLSNGSIQFSDNMYSFIENGIPVSRIILDRINGSDGEVNVTITAYNGSAIAPDDYNNTSITVSFANGETSKTITIPIINDSVYEPTETVNLALSNPTGGATLGTQTTAVLSIIDNDAVPGILAFSQANYSINEDSTPIVAVTVNRTGGSDGAVSATISLTDGTATGPDDYINTSATVNFANGETSKVVTIPIVNDGVFETNETIYLTLNNPTNGATLGSQNTATLTIIDNDALPGIIGFSGANSTVNEDGTPITQVTLTRTGGSNGEVSVTLTPDGGTATAGFDYNITPITITFASGETSKIVTIPFINDTVYEPTETVNLTLSSPTGGATLGTITAAVLNIIDDDAVAGLLSFSNAAYNINENGTSAAQVTVNRTGGSDGAVSSTVTLSNGTATAGSDYVANPININFANGETSKTVSIPIINDTVLENTETINLTLTNPTGGVNLDNSQKNAILNILDDDFKPTLTIITNPQQVTEGNTIQGTVFRNSDTTHPLIVALVNSDNSQIIAPNTVTIPAGANSANFNITAVDDTSIDLPGNYTIIATAAGFVGSSYTVALIDNDGVNLTLSLAANSISENGGKVQATVTRNIVTNTPLQVQLSSSDTTEATVPQTVIIPANQASITFEIQGIDDTMLDGTQSVIIIAKPTYTSSDISVDAGQATANLNVIDNESPSLTLTLDKNIISETGTATASITRNTPTTEPLTVNLASSDITEVTVPATVTIPVGQASASFIVTGVNDGASDAIQTVNLTASANGFNGGVKTIEVSDIDVPDLDITNLASTTNPIFTGKQSFLTYRVENKGFSPATGAWTDRIYLSTDNKFDISDSPITETTFSPTIPFNSFYERTIPFFAPRTVGEYYLIASTDANNTVNEGTGLGEQNNMVIIPITVIPAYKATVYTDTIIGTNGQSVPLRGSAVNNADNSPVPFEFVTIKIENNGTIREFSALTDGNGNFVKSFNPLPTEGGQYNINAYFPNNLTEDIVPEDSFQLLGMKFDTSQATNKVIADTPFTGTVTLENMTNIGITGIYATVDSVVPGWNVQVNTPKNLSGFGNNTLSYTITAPNDSYITQDSFNIRLTSAEGATAALPVNVNLERIFPRLVASTNLVNSGMLRGNQTLVEFQVTNEGGGIAKNIEVELPNEPWLKLASPASISALNPGESTKVTLLLTPDPHLSLTEYTGDLLLDAEGYDGDLSVKYIFRAISEAKGSIRINTVDELFYFAEGAPKLANATVTLRDYFTNEVIATAVTDNTGLINLANINEGSYKLEVKADKHDTFRQTIQLDAGETEKINAFLSRQTVQYNWTVTQTEIEDKYNITVESVFETNVPIPTVVIDPPLIDLEGLDVVGQVMQVDMTLTNHGLIAANDLRFSFSDHPFYKIEPLVSNIDSLGAKSSAKIPIRVTRIADENTALSSSEDLSLQISGNMETLSSGGGCGISGSVAYSYKCGGQDIGKSAGISFNNVAGSGGSCSWNPWGDGPGSFWGPGGTTTTTTSNCDPCVEKVLGTLVDCAINFIPIYADFNQCQLALFNCSKDIFIDQKIDPLTLPQTTINCVQAILKCFEAASRKTPIGKIQVIIDCTIDLLLSCQNETTKELVKGSIKAIRIINKLLKKNKIASSSITDEGSLDSNLILDIDIAKDSNSWTASSLDENTISSILLDAPDGIPQSAWDLLTTHIQRMLTVYDSFSNLFGSNVWLSDETQVLPAWIAAFLARTEGKTTEDAKVSIFERNELLSLPLPINVTGTDVNKFIDRWNRSINYWTAGVFLQTDVPFGESIDFIAFDEIYEISRDAVEAINQSVSEGFNFIDEGVIYAVDQLKQSLEGVNGGGVCAKVKISIDQEAVTTRSAFLGNLEIDNGNSTNLTDLAITLKITDQNGIIVDNLFGISNPILTNITAIDGTGVLGGDDPNTTHNEGLGSAQWTFIPTHLAAPQTATTYNIGGTLSYKENGQFINVPLLSTGITVVPQAELYLDYFQSRNVYGDDPFTDATEISVPFDLAVLVQNQGYGDAKNLRITSSQPEIVDNEKGLLIDFNIIGSQLNGQDVSPSLAVNFGDIKPGETAVADWLLKSTLQGKFIEYKATFEHINGLGNKELSLIKEVKIHELIHIVKASSDSLPDFLVDDQFDAKFYPDTLYFGNGTTSPVTAIDTATVDATVTIFDLEAEITLNATSGWNYIRLVDPANGQFQIKELRRSDGTLINVDNIWRTDRTFPATGRPKYENILHFLDYNSTGSYTISYGSDDSTAPKVREILDVAPNPRKVPVDKLTVVFTEPIRANTFDYQDLSLTLDNGVNLINNEVTISQADPITFQINNLASMTGMIGQYQFSVNALDIQDLAGNNGAGFVSENWTFTGDKPGIASITGFNSTLLNTSVDVFQVTFTEPINPSSFDYNDITLRRNNGESLLNNTVAIAQIDPTTFRVGNFAQFTNTEGDYQLLISSNSVQDLDNNYGVGGKGFNWVLDKTYPSITSITDVTSPRNTPVSSLEISFSEAIQQDSFDVSDLILRKGVGVNSAPQQLNGVSIQKRNETTYTIQGLRDLQSDSGTYSLAVNGSGIKDPAGNSVTNSLAETWLLDRTEPGSPTNIQVNATSFYLSREGIESQNTNSLNQEGQYLVNSKSISITGDLAEPSLKVFFKDLTASQDLGQAIVSGVSFGSNISLPSHGTHNLEIQVQDAAGNLSTTYLDVFVDITQPAITKFFNDPSSTLDPANSIDIQFSERVAMNTFDKSDISLSRNGVVLNLPDTVAVEFLSGTTYRIKGLGDLVNSPANYSMLVNATTIQDNAGNSGVAPKTATFSILAPPSPGISLTPAGGNTSVTEAGNIDTYNVVLLTQPTANVVISCETVGQVFLNKTALTFTPSNWNVPQAVTVSAIDDALTEGTHSASIQHSISSTDASYVGFTIPTLLVQVQDNDASITGKIWQDADGNRLNNGEGGLAGWTVFLDADLDGELDPGERTTLTDNSGAYRFDDLRPGAVSVAQVLQNGWRQTFPQLEMSTTASDLPLVLPSVDLGLPATGLASFNFSRSNYLVKEDGTALTEVWISRGGDLSQSASVTLRLSDGTATGCGCAASAVSNDFNFSPITITFSPNQAMRLVHVENARLANAAAIRIRDDSKAEASEDFQLQLTNPSGNAVIGDQGSATVTIIDNDSASGADLLASLATAQPDQPATAISLNPAASALIGLDAFLADSRFASFRGQGFSSVIIDTGMDVDHSLFGADLNLDGRADRLAYQYDFADGDANANDLSGHGTHIASIISSVASGSSLIALKVFKDSGSGSFADLERALQWVNANAAAYNIASVNLSLGDGLNWADPSSRYGLGDEFAALASQGVLISAAAGNSFYKFASTPGLSYPGVDPNVIPVGAVWTEDMGGNHRFTNGAIDFTTAPDRIASFSQRELDGLPFLAPGILIEGARAGGGTMTMGGTSQATAFVSALATIAQQISVAAISRRLTVAEFKTLLTQSADWLVDGDDENDNVINTGANFPRVNALRLAETIAALDPQAVITTEGSQGGSVDGPAAPRPTTLSLTHTINLVAGQVASGLDFGNQLLPTLSITGLAADQPEGNSGSTAYTFTVTRSGATSSTSSADWSVSGGGINPALASAFVGGRFPTGTVSFAAGEVSQTITVYVAGDTAVELDEGFTVTLSAPSGAILDATALSASGTILNDDFLPAPSLTLLTTTTFTEDSHAHGIGAVVASFTTSDALAVALSDSLHYALGSGADAGKVLLTAAGLALVNAGSDLPAFSLTPSHGAISGLAVSVDPSVIPANDGPASLAISGTAAVGNTLAVVQQSPDSDGAGTAPSISWQTSTAGGSWSAVSTNPTYKLSTADEGKQLRAVVSYIDGQGFNESITTPTLAVPLLPTVAINASTTAQQEGNIGSTPYSFSINRSGDLSGESRVSWSVEGSGANPATALDFAGGALPAGSALFGPGQDTLSLAISVVGDGSLEPDEGFRIQLHSPIGARLSTATSTGLLQILNDDQPAPTYSFVATPQIVYEGSTLHIAITTTNVEVGRSLWWQLSGTGINAADFSDGLLSGAALIGSDGRAAFTKGIAADAAVEQEETLAVRFFSDADRTQLLGSSLAVTIKEPSVGVVTEGNDVIIGTAAAEAVTGVPNGSAARGRGSLDRLTGGGGADIFLLGDAQGPYYVDGTSGLGSTDLALITDFTSDDRIQLHGASGTYRLVSGRHGGIPGVRIDALATAPGNTPEAIGFVQAATLASLTLTNPNQFLYV
jgi:Ca2+-binding RTX toxin-like protein